VVPAFPVPASIRTWLFKNSVRSSLEKVKAYVERAYGEKPPRRPVGQLLILLAS